MPPTTAGEVWGTDAVQRTVTIVVVVFCAVAFIYFCLPCMQAINLDWPEGLAPAQSARQKIHPDPGDGDPALQHHGVGGWRAWVRDKLADRLPDWALACLGWDDDYGGGGGGGGEPSANELHNHRPMTALERVQRLAGTAHEAHEADRGGGGHLRYKDTALGDRRALEAFFAATHRAETDWVNVESGSGRAHWLDVGKEIARWQGVTVYADAQEDGTPEWRAGRVRRLQLPRNGVNGPLDALHALTGCEKLSLWENRLQGTLGGLAPLSSLRFLDLSANRLGGTLDPLAGLVALEELSLAENQLEGTLFAVGGMRQLRRLSVHTNKLMGTLEGLAPLALTIQDVDVSHNERIYGEVPPALHERWAVGALFLNTTCTSLGHDAAGGQLHKKKTGGSCLLRGRANDDDGGDDGDGDEPAEGNLLMRATAKDSDAFWLALHRTGPDGRPLRPGTAPVSPWMAQQQAQRQRQQRPATAAVELRPATAAARPSTANLFSPAQEAVAAAKRAAAMQATASLAALQQQRTLLDLKALRGAKAREEEEDQLVQQQQQQQQQQRERQPPWGQPQEGQEPTASPPRVLAFQAAAGGGGGAGGVAQNLAARLTNAAAALEDDDNEDGGEGGEDGGDGRRWASEEPRGGERNISPLAARLALRPRTAPAAMMEIADFGDGGGGFVEEED